MLVRVMRVNIAVGGLPSSLGLGVYSCMGFCFKFEVNNIFEFGRLS